MIVRFFFLIKSKFYSVLIISVQNNSLNTFFSNKESRKSLICKHLQIFVLKLFRIHKQHIFQVCHFASILDLQRKIFDFIFGISDCQKLPKCCTQITHFLGPLFFFRNLGFEDNQFLTSNTKSTTHFCDRNCTIKFCVLTLLASFFSNLGNSVPRRSAVLTLSF